MVNLAFARGEDGPIPGRAYTVSEFLVLGPESFSVLDARMDLPVDTYLTFKRFEAVIALDIEASHILFDAGIMHFYLPESASSDDAIFAAAWALGGLKK